MPWYYSLTTSCHGKILKAKAEIFLIVYEYQLLLYCAKSFIYGHLWLTCAKKAKSICLPISHKNGKGPSLA